ncbi:MAG: FtsB family cell division protein [Thermomicrobiales bacterium]
MMRRAVGDGCSRLVSWLQRPVIILGLLLATGYASVGFIRQERTVRQITSEVTQRRQELHDATQEQQTLTAEIAALNDPARYAQYATLVARHTLMLTRPDETLLIVTWQPPSGQPAPPRATDWKALLRAANIPSP